MSTLRKRLAALEAGDGADAERYAIMERMEREWCEEMGIPEPTEAERAEFQREFDAAKPANWQDMTESEQVDFALAHLMDEIRAEDASETA